MASLKSNRYEISTSAHQHISTSAQQHISTSAQQHISTSAKKTSTFFSVSVSFIIICLTITANSVSAQPKVVFKNGTDCPVQVKVIFYEMVSQSSGPTATFTVPPQDGNSTLIPQNHGVCFIAADFNINGADEIKLSGDDSNIPENVLLCHDIADYFFSDC